MSVFSKLFGRQYVAGLRAVVGPYYRTAASGRKVFKGFRWKLRYKNRGQGFGTVTFKTSEECKAYLLKAVRVDPKNIVVIQPSD